MAVVAIRRNQWDAGSDGQQGVLRYCSRIVELGVPAVYRAGSVEWYVFHSSLFEVGDAAFLGAMAKRWQASRNLQLPSDSADARRAVRDDAVGRIVPVGDIALTEIVQVEVPVRIQVEAVDENGDPFDPPVLVWVDDPSGATQLVDVEQSLGDPYVLVLEGQVGVPAWIQCFTSVPDSWTPVEGVAV